MAALVAAPPNGDVNSTNFFLTVALAAPIGAQTTGCMPHDL